MDQVRSIHSALVGRDREVAELCAGLEDASAGRGRFFLVTGEPGIGKTRLADEVARRASDQAIAVLRAGCWEGGGAPACWPFVQVIRAALDGPDREVRRTNALRDAPALAQLILEDLHDSDQPSLLMLRFVVGQLRNAAVMVLATYRDVEVQRSPALSRLIGDLLREGTQVPLFPLSREDAARMIEERAAAPLSPRLVSDIHQASAGNPLFIDGLVRVLAAEGGLSGTGRLNLAAFRVPAGVRQTIRRWLDLLPDRSMLIVAAAIGQEFELRCLQRVTAAPNHQLPDSMRAAAAVGIVTALSPGRYRFTHALIRNALSDELNSADRAAIHLKIGDAIEELYPADIDMYAASLAHHFREGGAIDKAINYSIRAGEAARLLFAYEEAITHWEAALELMPEHDEERERRADLLERTAELFGMTASEGEAQFKYLRQALKLYRELGRSDAAARVEARIAGWLSMRGSAHALRHLKGSEKSDSSLGQDREGRTSLVWRLVASASAAGESGHVEESLTESRRAMEISEQLGDAVLRGRSSIVHAVSLFKRGDLDQAFALMRRASAEADRLNDTITGTGILSVYGHTLSWLCDPVEAKFQMERELAKPRMAAAELLRTVLLDWLQITAVLNGRLREINELVSRAQGDPPLEGLIAFYRGEWEQAAQILSQAANQARETKRHVRACSSSHWQARSRRALDQHLVAESILKGALALCIAGPVVPFELHTRAELASIQAETGQAELAHSHLARCREILAAGEDWRGLVGHIARGEAVVAAAERRFDDAQSQFARAVEIYRHYQVPFEEAEALHYWGRAMIAAGDRGMALEKLDAAAEIYRRHGAGERWIEAIQTDRLRAQNAAAISAARAPVAAHTAEMAIAPPGGDNPERGEDARMIGVFRPQGEYWTLSWAGSESRLRERKGFHYIAWLMRHPGREFAAQDLVFMAEPPSNGSAAADAAKTHQPDATIAHGLGDAGAALDATAKTQYRRRLEDLRAELEDAERDNDIGRAARAREEIEFIEADVTAAVALGGRNRKAASHSERVRLAVTKAIKAALASIRAANPELGRHLSLSIRTGNVCVYLPGQSITWQL